MLLKNKNYKKELQEYKDKTWSVIQDYIKEEVFYLMKDYKCNENVIKRYESKRLIWNRITFLKNDNNEIINPFRMWKRNKWIFYTFFPLLLWITFMPIVWINSNKFENILICILLFGMISLAIFTYIYGLKKYKKRCDKILADRGVYKPKRFIRKKYEQKV